MYEISRRVFGGSLMVGSLSIRRVEAMQADAANGPDMLPSWREGAAKGQILDFLAATTTSGSPDFVPAAVRTAVFDNDGTLWTEQPILPEVAFALARVRELAARHPEWSDEEPFKSALAGDMAGLARGGVPAMVKLAVATQSGTTPEQFHKIVSDWLRAARHPRFRRPYDELVYQPMREVLSLFVAHGFKCFVVSAGGLEFLRAFASDSYDLPPDRVIGSTLDLKFGVENGRADLTQLAKVSSFTNGPRKPAAIANIVGQRPLAAFGNSDGDYEMLQYVSTGPGRRLGVLLHHDDAEREFAYDREGGIAKLDRALDDATANNWLLVSMKSDWDSVYRS